MPGQIHRFKKERDYVNLDTHALRNQSLSLKAKGLHSYLLQLPENWKLNIVDLSKRSTDGRDSVGSAMTELIGLGYVIREQSFDEKGLFAGYDYNVFEQPEHAVAWKSVNGKSVNGKSVNGKSVNGKSVTNKDEESKELDLPNMKKEIADANAPLAPPFKKVGEIEIPETLEAEKKENDFTTGAGSDGTPGGQNGAAVRLTIVDPQIPGVRVHDEVPIQPTVQPKSTGRERAKNPRSTAPSIHPENEMVFSHFSDPKRARSAWAQWIKFKQGEHGQRYKTAESELIKIRSLFKESGGDSEMVELMVEQAIGNLWKGIFKLKSEKNGQHPNGLNPAQKQHLNLANYVASRRIAAMERAANGGAVD